MEKEEPGRHQSVGLKFALWASPVARGPLVFRDSWAIYELPTALVPSTNPLHTHRQVGLSVSLFHVGGMQSPTEWINCCMLSQAQLMPSQVSETLPSTSHLSS